MLPFMNQPPNPQMLAMAMGSPALQQQQQPMAPPMQQMAAAGTGPLTPAEQIRMMKRIQNAEGDNDLLKIQRELEKRGIDTSLIPAFQGGILKPK